MTNLKIKKSLHIAGIIIMLNSPMAEAAYASNLGSAVTAMNALGAAVAAAIQTAATSIVTALYNMSTQMSGDMEKQNAFNKQLAESIEDYDKEVRFKEHVAKVDMQNQVPTDFCNQSAASRSIKNNDAKRIEMLKSISRTSTARNMHTQNAPAERIVYLKAHTEKFCSETDALLTGCKMAPVELQNADIYSTTLLSPNETNSYSDEEDMAARMFIQNTVNPFPSQSLPKSAHESIQGKAFYASQLQEQRVLSLAEHSLNSIYAKRKRPNTTPDVLAVEPRSLSNLYGMMPAKVGLNESQYAASKAAETDAHVQECQSMAEQVTAQRQQDIEQYIPKPANESFTTGGCLDSLMKTRIKIWTLPSVDGVIDNIINAAKNKACNVVMSKWNNAISDANQAIGGNINVPYLGNVQTVSVDQSGSVVDPSSGVYNPVQVREQQPAQAGNATSSILTNIFK